MTLVLTRSDIESLVDTTAAIEVVEAALRAGVTGGVQQSAPFVIPTGDDSAAYLVLAAFDASRRMASAKLLADLPDNRGTALPAQRSVIVLSSAVDGAPVAILDGRIPTRERTAATSAVATRALARADSRILGLIGTGGLAEPHVRAIAAVRDIRAVVAWSRSRSTAEHFARALGDDAPPVEILDSPREVAERADVLCTLTPSLEPVVRGEWLRPGVHVNAVGAPPRPDHRELDSDAVARASVFVDDRETVLSESGDVLVPLTEGRIAPSDLLATLGEVVAGLHGGRTSHGEITLFDSVGMGLEDLAICAHYVAVARERGIGREIDLTE